MGKWKLEANVRWWLSTVVFETRVSCWAYISAIWARLASHQVPEILLSLSLWHWDCGCLLPCQACVHACMHAWVSVCMWGMCVLQYKVRALGYHSTVLTEPSPIPLHFTFWDTVSHWSWSPPIPLGWVATKPQRVPCLHLPNTDFRCTSPHTAFGASWGTELRSARSHAKHLANETISLAHEFTLRITLRSRKTAQW